MVSGLYISKCNPEYKRADTQAYQKVIKRKISSILNIWNQLGICERYGVNTVKIDRDKLKQFTLDDILSYTINDYKNNPIKKF